MSQQPWVLVLALPLMTCGILQRIRFPSLGLSSSINEEYVQDDC